MPRPARGVARPAVGVDLWREIRKLAIDLGASASGLAELGLRIVKAFIERGHVPGDCASVLPGDVASQLRELLERARPPSGG